jgi:hypothetical protein
LQKIPARAAPVPRRLLRALAAGLRQADTAYVLAFLIRALHWRVREQRFAVDGRMRVGRTAELFGMSPRAFTDARARLLDLGWIRALDVPQHLANRFGVHDVVNVDWVPEELVDNAACEPPARGDRDVRSARPRPPDDVRFASPDLTRRLPTETQTTRRLDRSRPEPDGVLAKRRRGRRGKETEGRSATIRHIEPADLDRTETLFALHAQFVEAGLAKGGTAGELDFLCLANRARTRGRNPGGLLRRLLELGRTDWITYADEEVATRRMRERWSAPSLSTILPINHSTRWGRATPTPPEREPESPGPVSAHNPVDTRNLTEAQHTVETCLRVAKQHRTDPYRVARIAKGWDRETWDRERAGYQVVQAQTWRAAEEASVAPRDRTSQGLALRTWIDQSGGGVTPGTGTAEQVSPRRPHESLSRRERSLPW